MRWPAVGLALLFIGLGPQNPQGPAPTRADAALSGVVSDESTKQSIADAIVTLGVADRNARRARVVVAAVGTHARP